MITEHEQIHPKKIKEQNEKLLNEIISEIIKLLFLENPSSEGNKVVINYLEKLSRMAQRCIHKPESKSEIKEEKLLEFINSDSENIKLVIGLIQKKLTDLKSQANVNFTKGKENLSPEKTNLESFSDEKNYFLIENLAPCDETSKEKLTFLFLIVINPQEKVVDLFSFDRILTLNYQMVNSVVNERFENYENLFNFSIKNFIEERNGENILNTQKLLNDISLLTQASITGEKGKIELENFTLNKFILTSEMENLKKVILSRNYHKHQILTNNQKLLKTLWVDELHYYCTNGQIVQDTLLVN